MDNSVVRTYFQAFFKELRSFSCDKAKEYAEKEKQPLLSTHVQAALSSLAQHEKLYYSLVFLEPKSWFGRREPLKNLYLNLKSTFLDIQKLEYRTTSRINSTDNEMVIVSTTCLQLAEFCGSRITCINLYMQIFKSLSMEVLDDLLKETENLLSFSSEQLTEPSIIPLKECFEEELSALAALFQASLAIRNWEYVNAIHSIQQVSSVLSVWKPLLAKNQGNSSFRSGFFSFGEKTNLNQASALYNWLDKFFNSVVAKFTFYFFEGLNRNSTSEEMKSALGKVSYDFVSRSLSFIKKNDARSISIFLDTREAAFGPQHGYNFPDMTLNVNAANPPEDFSRVLTLPLSCNNDVLGKEFLCEREEDHSDKIYHHVTSDKNMSIFHVRIELKMFLVLAFNGVKNEKDGNVLSFCNEILQHLKLKRVGLLIKPGSK